MTMQIDELKNSLTAMFSNLEMVTKLHEEANDEVQTKIFSNLTQVCGNHRIMTEEMIELLD